MISIHALREEGDRVAAAQFFFDFLFLSTPSARRATVINFAVYEDSIISIHALREEGDVGRCLVVWTAKISIHALREEGDQDIPLVPLIDDNFYPRPPRGGRRGRKG